MRAVLQRVKSASVSVGGQNVGGIGTGMVVLLGIAPNDDELTASRLAQKVAELRIFEDTAGKMNLSLLDTGAEALVVSQFTLYADCRRGRRPSFTGAASPEAAERLYLYFCDELRRLGVRTCKGRFGEKMLVTIENFGPVTIVLDSALL